MRGKRSLLKKTAAGILAAVFVFTAAPQMPLQSRTVKAEAAQVALSAKKVTLRKGESKKLKLKNASGKIKWKSSKKSVASVSASGLVKAKKTGKTTVTVTYKNKQYKCTVTVKASAATGSSSGSKKTATVYWTPGGSVYHVSKNCPTLSRSGTILSGSISKSGKSRACKVCS